MATSTAIPHEIDLMPYLRKKISENGLTWPTKVDEDYCPSNVSSIEFDAGGFESGFTSFEEFLGFTAPSPLMRPWRRRRGIFRIRKIRKALAKIPGLLGELFCLVLRFVMFSVVNLCLAISFIYFLVT